MDQEILSTLQSIRGILFFQVLLMCLVFIIWISHQLSNIINKIKSTQEGAFSRRADKYFMNANYHKLVMHCNNKLKHTPNHALATWWLARAEFEIGNKSEALILFERLQEIAPKWKETYIDPYLKKIQGGELKTPNKFNFDQFKENLIKGE